MKTYSLILADPPWWYAQRSKGSQKDPTKKTKFGGGASAAYPLMKDHEIVDLGPRIQAITAKDCALLLWATNPKLDVAMKVIEAWGFEFTTVAFTWVKTTPTGKIFRGTGAYTAANPEPILLGTRGKVRPAKRLGESSVILAPHPRYPKDHPDAELAGKIIHSRKPPEARERIVNVFGDVPRVELFCREPALGWDAVGNAIDGRDIREALA